MPTVTRRTLAQGVAWSLPALAATPALPAFAASCGIPSHTVQQHIDDHLTRYAEGLPDLSDVQLRTWFYDTGNVNGALGEGGIMLKNVSSKTVDFTKAPLMVEVAAIHVDTSPAVNHTLSVIKGPLASTAVANPCAPNADYGTPAPANARLVGRCGPGVNRRDMSVGTSFANVYSQDGKFTRSTPTELGEERMECLASTGHTAYGFLAGINTSFAPSAQKNVMALRPRDGMYSGGRIYVAYGIRVLRFVPPTWEELKLEYQGTLTDEQFTGCYLESYTTAVERWVQTQGLRGATVQSRGWSAAGWTLPSATGEAARGGDKRVSIGEWIWSHEAGNFHGASDPDGLIMLDGAIPDRGWRRTEPTVVFTATHLAANNSVMWRDGIY